MTLILIICFLLISSSPTRNLWRT